MSILTIADSLGTNMQNVQAEIEAQAGNVDGTDIAQLIKAQAEIAVSTMKMSFLAKVFQEFVSSTKQAQQTTQQA